MLQGDEKVDDDDDVVVVDDDDVIYCICFLPLSDMTW